MQRIYSQQSRASACSWCVTSRAVGCALSHREMLCYHHSAPKHFRPSSILLDSSYPLVLLMRLEQSPWPGGAARCSSGMGSVLELEGRGLELSVCPWHMCDDQLQFDTEIFLCYLPWRKAWILQHSSHYKNPSATGHRFMPKRCGGTKQTWSCQVTPKITRHCLPSNMRAGNPNLQSVLPCFYPHLSFIFLF